MKTNKQNADFLHIGRALLSWYKTESRTLPWRENITPYNIWISEIILQQTQVAQGRAYYLNFLKVFPTADALHKAETDEVLLLWKGLGYYSRALNLHKASQQIMVDYNGVFPNNYHEILKLKGVGKYTAAAIASICFGEKIPAVDGNFYRVLSRIFADDFDISKSTAFVHFSELALRIMPEEKPGDFNQAMMDLGAEICKPKNPKCDICPVDHYCEAYKLRKVSEFPVKSKKIKAANLHLQYYLVQYNDRVLIRQRDEDFIWKKLYEFCTDIPAELKIFITDTQTIKHQLTHKKLTIDIHHMMLQNEIDFQNLATTGNYLVADFSLLNGKSFPKPLENYLKTNIFSRFL